MLPQHTSRAQISGKLAEDFVLERWGVKEDDQYEVKATSSKNGQVVLKTVQLIQSGPKFFIIVCYPQSRRRLTRGPRRGKSIPAESLQESFKGKLTVHIVRGFDLLKIISREKRPFLMTKFDNDYEWAFYWTVRLKSLAGAILFEDERVKVIGDPLDPPKFLEGR